MIFLHIGTCQAEKWIGYELHMLTFVSENQAQSKFNFFPQGQHFENIINLLAILFNAKKFLREKNEKSPLEYCSSHYQVKHSKSDFLIKDL